MKRGRPRFGEAPPSGNGGRRANVLRAIATAEGLTTAERCVLYTIEAHVSYADRHTGRAWPSVATIARCSGVGSRWAQRIIASLADPSRGWLRVEKRQHRGAQITSAYRVTPPDGEAPAEDAPADSAALN